MTTPSIGDRSGFGQVRVLVLFALAACLGTVMSGAVSSLAYGPLESSLRSAGLTLQQLRPLHETMSFAWMFLGGLAAVLYYLVTEFGPLSVSETRRVWAALAVWMVAGIGGPLVLLSGHLTGREYMGLHPGFSVGILVGWVLFASVFHHRVGFGVERRPAFLLMWTIAFPLFLFTQIEGHLYLLEAVSRHPVRDIALQWKTNGVMVGSFNLLAYGAAMFVASRESSDLSYSRSRLAFALFVVGLLNTFTNYGHHTFHLPQTPVIHWTAFAVSMLEVFILAKVLLDLSRVVRSPGTPRLVTHFLRAATAWIFIMLSIAIVISIPPLNALMHGTHVVVAHAMGSMIGIDSMILWAVMAHIVERISPSQERRVRFLPTIIHVSFLGLFLSLLARGIDTGWTRFQGPFAPDLSQVTAAFPFTLAVSGAIFASAVAVLIAGWVRSLLSSR